MSLISGVLSACGGGNSSATTATGPPTISIFPSPAFVAAAAQEQFTALVTYESNDGVTWQVNGVTGGSAATGSISTTGLYTAPSMAVSATVTAISQADNSLSATSKVSVSAPHAIAVRPTASGIAEFYYVPTGSTFTPRGNNYVRLAQQTKVDGTPTYTISTFNVGLYDSARAETALATMQTYGYNTVRVGLNGCCPNTIGNPAGGMLPAYIANVADFVGRAANHDIYVIITTDWLADQGGYGPQNCNSFGPFNTLALCPDGVRKRTKFFQDFVQALTDQNARTDAILAYEIRNEYVYLLDEPPLSWTSGTVTPADGQTYDMSSASSRQQMMDNGIVYLTNQVRQGILSLDPTALVTVGFFDQTPGSANYTKAYPAIANSTADFVDLHSGGPGGSESLDQIVQDFGFTGYQQQKPILMGEFVATMADVALISDAAMGLQSWQIDSCTYSYKGWVLWTWDLGPSEAVPGDADWYATAGNGEINTALAPAVRPSPCQ
jgi:hypothetical protein